MCAHFGGKKQFFLSLVACFGGKQKAIIKSIYQKRKEEQKAARKTLMGSK
jgi:fructose 1,6-bisphosphatase